MRSRGLEIRCLLTLLTCAPSQMLSEILYSDNKQPVSQSTISSQQFRHATHVAQQG